MSRTTALIEAPDNADGALLIGLVLYQEFAQPAARESRHVPGGPVSRPGLTVGRIRGTGCGINPRTQPGSGELYLIYQSLHAPREASVNSRGGECGIRVKHLQTAGEVRVSKSGCPKGSCR